MMSSNGLNKVQASARSLQKSESCLKALPDLFRVRPIETHFGFQNMDLPQEIWSHIFGFLTPNVLQTNVSLVCKYWLEIVRNDTKYLKLGEHFLKKYFELETLKLDDEKLDSLMTNYLMLWPNVRFIQMDWVQGNDIINLHHDIKISRNW